MMKINLQLLGGNGTSIPKKKSGTRESRGQLDYQGRENGIKQIMTDVGANEEKANAIYDVMGDYTGSWYTEIRNANDHEFDSKRNQMENYISNAPTYDGEIYRGLHTNNSNFVDQLQKGATIDMGGISSWSSEKRVANNFADKYHEDFRILFTCKNKTGVGIKHISSFPEENEVLQSGKTKFKINKVSSNVTLNGITKIKVQLEEI